VSSRAGTNEALEIRLDGLKLVDTSELTWEQILEVRSDPVYSRKAWRFRLFFADNFAGKDPNYVRDKLTEQIENYVTTCKRNGLKLALSAATKLLDSKSLLGALGLTGISILTGNLAVASASLLAGAAIELGKVSLHVAGKSLDFEKESGSEIALLLEIDKRRTTG